MSESTQLVTKEQQLAPVAEPSVGLMLQSVIAGGVTEQNVAVLERMCDLYERMKGRESEQAFASAFVALQRDMPVIVAKSVIPNRGKYERFEDVMNVVGPLLIKNGFATSFSNSYTDNRITETCTLSHIGGHSRSNSFTVRVGGKADSDTQADCKAATTAKRNALLNALNIVIRQDCLQDEDSGAIVGGTITQQQADELREWVDTVKADRTKFLAFAGAETFETISTSKMPVLEAELRKRGNAK